MQGIGFHSPGSDGSLLHRKLSTTHAWPGQDSSLAPCCQKFTDIRTKTSLSVLVFDLNGQQVQDGPKVSVHLCACAPAAEYTTNYDGLAGVEIRGSSSARDHTRKSWALELRDILGEDRSEPILGVKFELKKRSLKTLWVTLTI
jgi:hypothetical protein